MFRRVNSRFKLDEERAQLASFERSARCQLLALGLR
jgi:hypothetical protein